MSARLQSYRATVRTGGATLTHDCVAEHAIDVALRMAEIYAGCAYACTVRPLKQGGAA